jgi:hypothetical protein
VFDFATTFYTVRDFLQYSFDGYTVIGFQRQYLKYLFDLTRAFLIRFLVKHLLVLLIRKLAIRLIDEPYQHNRLIITPLPAAVRPADIRGHSQISTTLRANPCIYRVDFQVNKQTLVPPILKRFIPGEIVPAHFRELDMTSLLNSYDPPKDFYKEGVELSVERSVRAVNRDYSVNMNIVESLSTRSAAPAVYTAFAACDAVSMRRFANQLPK